MKLVSEKIHSMKELLDVVERELIESKTLDEAKARVFNLKTLVLAVKSQEAGLLKTNTSPLLAP
jgi:hypothetical protein